MKKRRTGFTLVELIVVVAIIAVLAALVLPRFDTLLKNANHAAAASSMADAGQLIEAWYSSSGYYPDGWDTRLDTTGNLLPASTPSSAGLPTELVGTTGRLTTTTLSAGDVQGFINKGITTLYSYDAAPLSELTRPDDQFNTATVMTSGGTAPTVAIINAANANKIIDHIYPNNLVVGSTTGSGFVATNVKLVAFGLGAHNSMRTGSASATNTTTTNLSAAFMREAPIDPSFNSTVNYNRLLVVFEVKASSTSGGASSVTLAGVFGADGDLITDDAAAVNSTTP